MIKQNEEELTREAKSKEYMSKIRTFSAQNISFMAGLLCVRNLH